jgi:imidazolonepropionase-like amidohydrolase
MRLDIVNASGIVTGDGVTVLENTSIVVENGFITDLPPVNYVPYNAYADRFIDAQGGLVIPGIINIHTHGSAMGLFLSYAWKPLTMERWFFNMNTHLLEGTTTVLNGDGFTLPEEVDAANKIHPINIKTGTLHTPGNLKTFDIIPCSGEALDDWHRNYTIKEAVAHGAVAIAEVGSPSTTAGTFEKCHYLGKVISVNDARALDHAVVADDEATIRKVLAQAGIAHLTTEEAKDLVDKTSFAPIRACCEAMRDSVSYSRQFDLPVLCHAEPGMADAIIDVAKELGPRLVSVHSSHSFAPEAAVAFAKEVKKAGGTVEVCTSDYYHAKQVDPSPEATYALLREGLVDIITTDYSGGYHEPILLLMQKAIEEGLLTLPGAIKLSTSNPVTTIPKLAPNKGLIERGRVADLCIVDKDDISKVKDVIIFGRVIVEEGRIIDYVPGYHTSGQRFSKPE